MNRTWDKLKPVESPYLVQTPISDLPSPSVLYDLAGNRTNKTHNGVTVSFDLGAGNRMTNWTAQVSTNAEAVMYVAGYSTEDIGTDPRYGEWTVNSEDAEVLGSNFWSTTIFSDLSQTSHTVIAAIGDEAGNVGRDTNTWTLTIITNAAYSYDDAGNVTEIAYNSNLLVRTLGWGSQYQLLSVSNGTSEVESYTYDPFGRRLSTTTGTNTITHLYDGIHCIADLSSSGDLIRSYTYGPGIDNALAMTVYGDSTNTYYYLTDHLGSVLALTDEDGSLVESYEYDAFGRIRVFDSDFEEISESSYGNRIAFQGREYSWATGLHYFRARWYEPVTGRWLSKDPIGISGGLNQYVAFGGNGVNFTDPTGLRFKFIQGHGATKEDVRRVRNAAEQAITRGTVPGAMMADLRDDKSLTVFIEVTDVLSGCGPINGAPWVSIQPNRGNYGVDDVWALEDALVHEMMHAYRIVSGKYRGKNTPEDEEIEETVATYLQNRHRDAMGLKPRKVYANRYSIPPLRKSSRPNTP